jgi:hypothetical protein
MGHCQKYGIYSAVPARLGDLDLTPVTAELLLEYLPDEVFKVLPIHPGEIRPFVYPLYHSVASTNRASSLFSLTIERIGVRSVKRLLPTPLRLLKHAFGSTLLRSRQVNSSRPACTDKMHPWASDPVTLGLRAIL